MPSLVIVIINIEIVRRKKVQKSFSSLPYRRNLYGSVLTLLNLLCPGWMPITIKIINKKLKKNANVLNSNIPNQWKTVFSEPHPGFSFVNGQ